MVQPTGSLRPLFYPLNRSEDLDSDTPNDAITYIDLSNWGTSDPDERVDIVLNLSLNEYVALATAIDVGRDIAYGDNSIYLWWIWVRALISVDICAAVANCIQTSTEVQDALNSTLVLNQNIGQGFPDGIPASIGELQTYAPETCNPDNAYALALQLTDFVNGIIVDVFEAIESATFFSEQLSKMISAIPLIGQLPFDELISIVENTISQLYTAYAGEYDEAMRRDISCLIFCLYYENDCDIDFQALTNLFLEIFGKSALTIDLDDLGEFLAEGVFSGEEWVYLAFTIVFSFLAMGSSVADYDANFIAKAIMAYSNDTDSDWMIYCDDCSSVWCVILDFDNPDGTISSFCGNPSGQELLTDNVLCDGAYWARYFATFSTFLLTYFEVTTTFTGSNAQARFATSILNGGSSIDGYAVSVPTGGSPSFVYDNPSGAFCNEIQIYARNGTTGTPPTSNTARITKVEIRGIGDNPFVNATVCP